MPGLSPTALLALAFSAGTATFFAPCAFPLVPGYVSYFLGDTAAATARTDGPLARSDDPLAGRLRAPIARAGLIGVAASLGITLVYVGLAGTTIALGAGALADVAVLELVVGALFVVAGVAMAAGWRVSHPLVRLPRRRRSTVGFFLFGVLYAGAAAGCTAPLFVAVVARGLTAGPLLGVALAVAYAAGTSAVLIGVTGVAALGGSSVLSTLSGYTDRIYRVAGGLLALSGVAELYYYVYGFPEVLPR
jgi:cytochrome c-type biogenesis protein